MGVMRPALRWLTVHYEMASYMLAGVIGLALAATVALTSVR